MRRYLLGRLFACAGIGSARRDGLRCMTIELRETVVKTLIRTGLLRDEARNDLQAVRNAFYRHLVRTFDS
jgi:hypothetical protein